MAKILTFSFDDGTLQDIRLIELMNKYGIKSTFNLNSGLLGKAHSIEREGKEIDHTEIEERLIAKVYAGHEIAVHTRTHPSLWDLDKAGVIDEVEGDRVALEALCGYPIVGMAYPGGPFYNEFVIKTILQNSPIRYARNVKSDHLFDFPPRLMEWKPTCAFEDKKLFELVDTFLNAPPAQDLLFYIWGHAFEFDQNQSWDRVEEFFIKMGGRSDVLYLTNAQVLAYMDEHAIPYKAD